MSGKLKWYAARLMAMSPAEVAHRFGEVWQKRRLASVSGGWASFDDAQLAVEAFRELRGALAQAAPGSLSVIKSDARYLGHGPSAFHLETGGMDWLRDPVSGRRWPGAESPAFAVDVRSTSATPSQQRPYGDVKFVWELNRLQILHALAPIVAADGEGAGSARKLGFELLASWMEANPPYRGVNWISGIELALRLVSLTLFFAALDPGSVTGDERRLISRFVLAHARMLHALPSLYSSANNHRIAEGLGLYLSGRLLPEADERLGHSQKGRAILEAEALKQILADGVGAEQSPTYQAFSMEMIAFAALLEMQAGRRLSPAAMERLRAGALFLADLQNGAGATPSIGDDDEGRTLLWPHRDEPLYVSSVVSCVAALTGDRMASARPGYFRETLFGVNHEQAVRPLAGIRRYDTGGYAIIRWPAPAGDMRLVFDHGPLGYLSLSAHGHADALALWLDLGDTPIFVDAGAWLYHSGEAMRGRLRSSQSHNTLTLGNASQSEPSAAFSWASRANARRVEPDPAASNLAEFAVAGEHDGYRKRFGVTHRRDIFVKGGQVQVMDRLEGAAAPLEVSISFLCAPELSVAKDGPSACISLEGTALLQLRAPEGFELTVEDAPYSPRFGVLRTTARILLRGWLSSKPCVTMIDFGTS